MDAIKNKTSRETQVKVDGQVRRKPKEDEIICLRAKVEDRQEWNKIVEQTKTLPSVVQLIEEEEENSKRYPRWSSAIVAVGVPGK